MKRAEDQKVSYMDRFQVFHYLDKGNAYIETGLNVTGVIFIVILMLFTASEIIARYVFTSPIPGYVEDVELIVTDGGKGLLAALPMVYPKIPIQRCWAHKSRNVLNYVRKADREVVKDDLHAIQYASGIKKAQMAIGSFTRRWKHVYPRAVSCLLNDEEHLLSFFQVNDKNVWPQIRTTNAIERRFREVRRRTRPMGVFSDKTSMERILYAVFSYENLKQGVATPFLAVTQKC